MQAPRRRAHAMVAFVLAGTLAAGAVPAPLAAQSGGGHADVALILKSTTLGFGLELGKLITDHFAVRVGGNYFKFSASATKSNVSYDASLKLHSFTGLIDFFPGSRGSFHLTGGVITNPITISGTGTPDAQGNFTLNGHSYNTAQVGVLSGEAKYPDAGPYVGFGFGTPARKGPIAFFFDMGAMIGQPTITLTATGAATNAQLAADLQAQADTTQHDIRKYAKVYPVIGAGIAFRF